MGAKQFVSWRRGWDLNPRTSITRLVVFKTTPLSHLGTPPKRNLKYSTAVILLSIATF